MKKIYKLLFIVVTFIVCLLLTSCKKNYTVTIKGDRNVLEGEQIALSIETNKESFSVEWSSSNPEVASVNNYGVVTGIREGTSQIRVKIDDLTADALITVTKFVISVSSDKYLHIGDKTKVLVTHNSKQEKEVFFSSTFSDVATIDSEGNVLAVGIGETTITITVSGIRKSFVLKVLDDSEELPVEDPNVDPTEPVDPEPIDPEPVDPNPPVINPLEIYVPTIIKYDDTIFATASREVDWYSSNESVLMFGEEDEILIMDFGKATIKAVDKNNVDAYAEKEVYIVLTDIAPNKIEIYNEDGKYEVPIERIGAYIYSSLQLKIRAIDSDDNADVTVIWQVDDESIAAISDNGLVIPNKYGEITVKAISVFDANVFATIKIKVVQSTGNK